MRTGEENKSNTTEEDETRKIASQRDIYITIT